MEDRDQRRRGIDLSCERASASSALAGGGCEFEKVTCGVAESGDAVPLGIGAVVGFEIRVFVGSGAGEVGDGLESEPPDLMS